MLTTRTPMKRTGFKRKPSSIPANVIKQGSKNMAEVLDADFLQCQLEASREQRLAERAARTAVAMAKGMAQAVTMGPNTAQAAPVEKEKLLRSEPYRRLVAALPCIHCGIEGYSQHAHENAGKVKGMKADDRCAMPLCCTRPGIEGCHAAFDQYRLLPGGREAHHTQGHAWAKQTRNQIHESGQWPVNLPMWRE